jgi:hypothetical protein
MLVTYSRGISLIRSSLAPLRCEAFFVRLRQPNGDFHMNQIESDKGPTNEQVRHRILDIIRHVAQEVVRNLAERNEEPVSHDATNPSAVQSTDLPGKSR